VVEERKKWSVVSSGVPLLSSTQCSRTLGADELCGSILNVLLML
jgi:hypothetical protein